MNESITKALIGGIRTGQALTPLAISSAAGPLQDQAEEREETALATAAPNGEAPALAPSAPEPDVPRVRGIGRRALRGLRPLFLPFLHRFEWRVRTAVQKELDPRVAMLESLLDRSQQMLHQLGNEQQARHAALVQSLARLSQALDVLSVQRELREAATDQSLGEVRQVLQHLTTQSFLRLDRLPAIEQQAIALSEQSSGLIQRADLLLQRDCIPLPDGSFLVRTPFGRLVAPGDDEALLSVMVESGGVPEPGSAAVAQAVLQPGDTAIDVGAHVGAMTLPMAMAVGPAGKVFAFEPIPRVAALLRRTLALNGLGNRVTLHECAAGDADGEATLHIGSVLSHSSLLPLETATDDVSVPVKAIDSLIQEGQSIGFVKIDAEGYEPQVWAGMTRIIAENERMAAMLEFGPSHLARSGVSIEDWIGHFRAFGFSLFEIDERDGTCRALREHGLGEIQSVNILLLRQPPDAYPKLRIQS